MSDSALLLSEKVSGLFDVRTPRATFVFSLDHEKRKTVKEENVGKFNFLGKAIAHASAGAAVLIGIAVIAVG